MAMTTSSRKYTRKVRSRMRATAQKSGRSQSGRRRSTARTPLRWSLSRANIQVGMTSRLSTKLNALSRPRMLLAPRLTRPRMYCVKLCCRLTVLCCSHPRRNTRTGWGQL